MSDSESGERKEDSSSSSNFIRRKARHVTSPSYAEVKKLASQEAADLLDYALKLLSFDEPMDLKKLQKLYAESVEEGVAKLVKDGAKPAPEVCLATINCAGLDMDWLDANHVYSLWRIFKKRSVAILMLQEVDSGSRNAPNTYLRKLADALNRLEESGMEALKATKAEIVTAAMRYSSTEKPVGKGYKSSKNKGMSESLGFIFDTTVVKLEEAQVLICETGRDALMGRFSITLQAADASKHTSVALTIVNVHAPPQPGDRATWCGDLTIGENLKVLQTSDFICGDFNEEPAAIVRALKGSEKDKRLSRCEVLNNLKPTHLADDELPAKDVYDYFVQINPGQSKWKMLKAEVNEADHRLRNSHGDASQQLLSDHLTALLRIVI